jgi:hypothetical protein
MFKIKKNARHFKLATQLSFLFKETNETKTTDSMTFTLEIEKNGSQMKETETETKTLEDWIIQGEKELNGTQLNDIPANDWTNQSECFTFDQSMIDEAKYPNETKKNKIEANYSEEMISNGKKELNETHKNEITANYSEELKANVLNETQMEEIEIMGLIKMAESPTLEQLILEEGNDVLFGNECEETDLNINKDEQLAKNEVKEVEINNFRDYIESDNSETIQVEEIKIESDEKLETELKTNDDKSLEYFNKKYETIPTNLNENLLVGNEHKISSQEKEFETNDFEEEANNEFNPSESILREINIENSYESLKAANQLTVLELLNTQNIAKSITFEVFESESTSSIHAGIGHSKENNSDSFDFFALNENVDVDAKEPKYLLGQVGLSLTFENPDQQNQNSDDEINQQHYLDDFIPEVKVTQSETEFISNFNPEDSSKKTDISTEECDNEVELKLNSIPPLKDYNIDNFNPKVNDDTNWLPSVCDDSIEHQVISVESDDKSILEMSEKSQDNSEDIFIVYTKDGNAVSASCFNIGPDEIINLENTGSKFPPKIRLEDVILTPDEIIIDESDLPELITVEDTERFTLTENIDFLNENDKLKQLAGSGSIDLKESINDFKKNNVDSTTDSSIANQESSISDGVNDTSETDDFLNSNSLSSEEENCYEEDFEPVEQVSFKNVRTETSEQIQTNCGDGLDLENLSEDKADNILSEKRIIIQTLNDADTRPVQVIDEKVYETFQINDEYEQQSYSDPNEIEEILSEEKLETTQNEVQNDRPQENDEDLKVFHGDPNSFENYQVDSNDQHIMVQKEPDCILIEESTLLSNEDILKEKLAELEKKIVELDSGNSLKEKEMSDIRTTIQKERFDRRNVETDFQEKIDCLDRSLFNLNVALDMSEGSCEEIEFELLKELSRTKLISLEKRQQELYWKNAIQIEKDLILEASIKSEATLKTINQHRNNFQKTMRTLKVI